MSAYICGLKFNEHDCLWCTEGFVCSSFKKGKIHSCYEELKGNYYKFFLFCLAGMKVRNFIETCGCVYAITIKCHFHKQLRKAHKWNGFSMGKKIIFLFSSEVST